MRKKLSALILIMLLSAASVMTVWADEVDEGTGDTTEQSGSDNNMGYQGEVDIITEDPIYNDADEDPYATVSMSDGSFYDPKSGLYVYTAGNGYVGCSVADGMVVTDPVSFNETEEAAVELYYNGEKADGLPASVSAVGSYVLVEKTEQNDNQIMSFQIVNSVTGSLYNYILPKDFDIRSVYYEGSLKQTEKGSVELSDEGYYEIRYYCTKNLLEYNLSITVDHTPPEITLEGLDEYGRARGPVTVQGITEEDTVTLTYNEDASKLGYDDTVSESGDYHIVVADPAGNTFERDFTILLYLNNRTIIFFAILLAVIVGVAAALYISRKRLRVR